MQEIDKKGEKDQDHRWRMGEKWRRWMVEVFFVPCGEEIITCQE